MQFLALLAAVTALCASGASATCYGSGADWGDKNDANKQLVSACNSLTGTYSPGQQRSACRKATGGALFSGGKYDFNVRNQNNHAYSLSPDVCVRNLAREIKFCNAGGYETFDNVFFSGDPNFGSC